MTNLLRPEPVVVLTDYDLDGAGSSVLLDFCYNVVGRKQQGYSKLQKNLELIHAEYPNIKTLVAADICFTPESMQWALEHFDHVVYYDHHEFSTNWVELAKTIPDRLTVYFDLGMCSAALVYQSYLIQGNNLVIPTLSEFVVGVNAYDMWYSEDQYFERGLKLNDCFWELHMQQFRERFQLGWNFFTETEEAMHKAKTDIRTGIIDRAAVEELESGSKIVMIDDPDAVNFVPLYMEGDIFYVLYPNRGTGKIHLSGRTKGKLKQYNLAMAVEELKGERFMSSFITAGGGHAGAIGVQFADGVKPNAMAEWITDSLDERVRNW